MQGNYEHLSRKDALNLLRKWRENNERQSEDVMEIFLNLLDGDVGDIGNEKFLVYEQVLYAALDCHKYYETMHIMKKLSQTFPGSLRVLCLGSANLEAEGKYEEALEVLDRIIKADDTHTGARKRRIAVLKEMGLITEAIKELADYLKKFMCDVEAWQELCELYLQVQEYSRAAFCAEELILHQPHNHLMHQRLADIRYTMGGLENMELAKTYYCQALKLNPDNNRALFGLFLTTNNLLNLYKSSGSSKRKEAWKLCQFAQAQVARRQREVKPRDGAPDLTQLMLNLAIND